jgi:hypothetical protein
VSIGILEDTMPLDFKSPFDELNELRAVLTTQEIADVTGLRRETISRARPDSRFQRRTEKALGDLYLVVSKMKAAAGEQVGQLGAVLRRPQHELGGRSIAELLREGQVEAVLASLAPREEPSEREMGGDSDLDERVVALLDADLELRSRLSAIEAALVEQFGPGAEVERKIIEDYEAPERSEEIYLRVHTDLPFDEKADRLGELLEREQDLLAPVLPRLTIGFLG